MHMILKPNDISSGFPSQRHLSDPAWAIVLFQSGAPFGHVVTGEARCV